MPSSMNVPGEWMEVAYWNRRRDGKINSQQCVPLTPLATPLRSVISPSSPGALRRRGVTTVPIQD